MPLALINETGEPFVSSVIRNFYNPIFFSVSY